MFGEARGLNVFHCLFAMGEAPFSWSSFEHDRVAVVDYPVDHGRGHLVVCEHRAPPGELEVGRHDQVLPLVAFGHDLE